MFEKLEELERRFIELEKMLGDPDISAQNRVRCSKERAELEDIVSVYSSLKVVAEAEQENRALLDDSELAILAREELDELSGQREQLEETLRKLLLPKDPNLGKNVFLEIRAGAGGEEAALFAADLIRMYSRYCENRRWKIDTIIMNETGIGGIKELVVKIEGREVYGKLRYESGVHRVQRIPSTEAGGRIHTSTATVAVLPEADEIDVEVDEKDLKVDTFRSSGPGGQHVNKTDSAIRITHLPTGIVVQCQDDRSQQKNRVHAMSMLRAKLYEVEEHRRMSEISRTRKTQVGSGDRSEKIRTYNFPQGRITDHRIGLTLHKIEAVLGGDLDPLLDPISAHFQAESLKNLSED
ncbi:MAG: peptide chain release factor 1 [Candidatus Dadabacteria bacterium]|nr:peptide chain release factor 1 [Candidatus Dadabacteria bacterium]